jgi:hypothetical protein
MQEIMFWKTTLPLFITAQVATAIPEGLRTAVFMLVSLFSTLYWINRISKEQLSSYNNNWGDYLVGTFKLFISRFKK